MVCRIVGKGVCGLRGIVGLVIISRLLGRIGWNVRGESKARLVSLFSGFGLG
jgi:cytochrome b